MLEHWICDRYFDAAGVRLLTEFGELHLREMAMFSEHTTGTFLPSEIFVVQAVFKRIASADWVSQKREHQRDLAKYVLKAYESGIHDENELYFHCKTIAETRFSASEQ